MSVLMNVVSICRNRSGLAWASCSCRKRVGSILLGAVIALVSWSSVRGFPEDHAVAAFASGPHPGAGGRRTPLWRTRLGVDGTAERLENRTQHGARLAALISGVLTFGPLPDQLLDRGGQGGFEVDEFRPGRGDDDPDHAVVERADLGFPLDALLGCHLVAAVHLQILVRDAVDDVQLGPSADEQDLRRV